MFPEKWNVFRLLRRNNELKINYFLTNIWHNNWRSIIDVVENLGLLGEKCVLVDAHRNIYFVKQSNFDPPWSKVPLTLNIPRRGRPLWFSSEVSAKIILNYFFLCQNRQKMGFSNLSVLKKGLLFQDWVFKLGTLSPRSPG